MLGMLPHVCRIQLGQFVQRPSLVLAGAMLVRAAVRTPPSGRRWLVPFGLALVSALWPLNTHPALYSAMWSQFVWWLVALYCAAHGAALTETNTSLRE